MKDRLGAFEVPIATGRALGGGDASGRHRYGVELAAPNDKVSSGAECSLRLGATECLATVESVEGPDVVVATSRPVDLTQRPAALVIYPWFLYDRLLAALGDLTADDGCVDRALALFGKGDVHSSHTPTLRNHSALNVGQRAATQLCNDSSLAFVWGPPGTGKTTTLAHIVDELSAQDRRVLLVSTTNAALDHVLEQLAGTPGFRDAIAAGRVVRLGNSDRDTFGAGVDEVVRRLHQTHQDALERLRPRLLDSNERIRLAEALLARLAAVDAPQQTLFATPSPRVSRRDLASLFPPAVAGRVAELAPSALSGRVRARRARHVRRSHLCEQRIAEHERALRTQHARVVADARCVLATLSNAYLSPLMTGLRFDDVVAEEASMAVLPSLFYAACLANRKTIMVGDPRQLPPIVQSDDPHVHQVMGRNIFDVTVPEPASSPLVALLQTQYRMHPDIGELVSTLCYGGRLVHAATTSQRSAIADQAPFAGDAVVVVDTCGSTRCHSPPGTSSRANVGTAALCAQLALEAVRAGAKTVGVVTPYALQAREIRSRLGAWRDAQHIQCSTIHKFQGQERDVVVVDLVDAAPMRPGVLLAGTGPTSAARNLLNVSLSRARGKLILVADVEFFERSAPDSIVAETLRLAIRRGRRVPHR